MKPAFRREALEDVEAIAEYIRLDSPVYGANRRA